jgi:hypothetical protein
LFGIEHLAILRGWRTAEECRTLSLPAPFGRVFNHFRETHMKTTLATVLLGLAFLPATGFAADKSPADKPGQQNRMKTCNADAKAKSLKGDERKTFMSQCLKSK